MKKFEKIWQTEYENIKIVVKNAWDLARTSEEIRINDRVVYHNDVPIERAEKGKCLDFDENGVKITVKIGGAWHFFGAACQILINDEYFYGNRIVLFAKKAEK